MLNEMGSMLSYMIFVADFSVAVLFMVTGHTYDRGVCVSVVVLIVVLPMCLMRRVSSLRLTGLMATLFVVYVPPSHRPVLECCSRFRIGCVCVCLCVYL